jgi:hypothetical protein
MYLKIESNTTYIDYMMIRLHASSMKYSTSGLFNNYLKNNYMVFELIWDPSVTDGMSRLGSYNRYYNFPILLLRYSGKRSSCTQHPAQYYTNT